MNATIEEFAQVIRETFPLGEAIDEERLREMFSNVNYSYMKRGISPMWIQLWLDKLRRKGQLRMEGFKYFRVKP